MEAELRPKIYISVQIQCPELLTDTNHTATAAKLCGMRCRNVQENPSNGSLYTADRAQASSNKGI
jgi:hypothetical protein